ncbi:MAG: magnesium chelatase [SAR202 cluster bacterium]|nr:magnesium chelatase [SAR202 cluster bacterium]
MPTRSKSTTLASLRRSGHKPASVRQEMRKNLAEKIKNGERLFPGIVGYDDTVIPQLENAILAGQDIILLGERGQAKSRIIRQMVSLLNEEVPAIAGCEINDDPFNPICTPCKNRIAKEGDKIEIAWIARDERYSEKLATPDISIADLIGEVDPIKVAEGRYLADEYTIHYGLVPRTNRGIFCINELPDLAERVQVGLFNLMEERDVQIKGYRIRLPLDIFVVATANPEDYTNRGRIITPLKDRYGAQIRTHYPHDTKDEIAIMDQERSRFLNEDQVFIPPYFKEVIADITALARKSQQINQRSGVSVRVSIANLETVIGNATRRALRSNEEWAVPRISDLPYIQASFTGKVEMESFDEGKEGKIIDDLVKRAVLGVFGRHLDVNALQPVVQYFEDGKSVEVGSQTPAAHYVKLLSQVPALEKAIARLGPDKRPEAQSAAVEFVLEGLYLNRKLNRESVNGRTRYGALTAAGAPRREK